MPAPGVWLPASGGLAGASYKRSGKVRKLHIQRSSKSVAVSSTDPASSAKVIVSVTTVRCCMMRIWARACLAAFHRRRAFR